MSKIAKPGDYVRFNQRDVDLTHLKTPRPNMVNGDVFQVKAVQWYQNNNWYLFHGDWLVNDERFKRTCLPDEIFYAEHFDIVKKVMDFTDIFNPQSTWVDDEQDS